LFLGQVVKKERGDKMDYQDFLERVQKDLMDKLSESLKAWIDEIDVRESSEELSEGILIWPKGSRFTLAMNLEPFYLDLRWGGRL